MSVVDPNRDSPPRFNPISQENRPRPTRSRSASPRQASPVIPEQDPGQVSIQVGPYCLLLQPNPTGLRTLLRQWLDGRQSAILPDVTYNNPKASITLTVGPQNIPYRISTQQACRQSPFFDRMVNGPAPNHTIHMGESSDYTVVLLLEWLYHRTLTVRTLEDNFIDENPINAPHAYLTLSISTFFDQSALLQLWVVADKFSIPALQNAALSKLASLSSKYGFEPVHSVLFVYNNTSEDSKLRHYVLHQVCRYLNPEKLKHGSSRNRFPYDFLLDMGHHLLRLHKGVFPQVDHRQYFVPEEV